MYCHPHLADREFKFADIDEYFILQGEMDNLNTIFYCLGYSCIRKTVDFEVESITFCRETSSIFSVTASIRNILTLVSENGDNIIRIWDVIQLNKLAILDFGDRYQHFVGI